MKELILLRGLPGAGKSTLAGILAENKYPAFSVDDYFTDENGNYIFIFEENHLAYKTCENKTRTAMRDGAPKIFVHNTFTMDWEMKPYIGLAGEFNYRLHVVTVENYHDQKNIHQVSEEQIAKMAGKYQLKLF